MPDNEVKLTPAQARLYHSIVEAGSLFYAMTGRGYCLPDGRPANTQVVNNLRRKGLLRDAGDTLFPGVRSQTMMPRHGQE